MDMEKLSNTKHAHRRKLTYEDVNHKLPSEGFVRVNQLCNHNGVRGILSISKSSFWAGVKEGRFPRPVKLGKRTSCWSAADIRRIINSETAQ
jgi:predicted DNA-binding transcriptional regulator AlpA